MSQRDDALEMLDRLVGCFHDRLGNPSPVDETKLAILRAAIDRAYPPEGDPIDLSAWTACGADAHVRAIIPSDYELVRIVDASRGWIEVRRKEPTD